MLYQLGIYEFKCDEQLFTEFCLSFDNHIQRKEIDWQNLSKPNLHEYATSIGYLNDENEILTGNFSHWINDCIQKISDKHFFSEKLKVVDCWYTKTEFGQSSSFHFHSHSILSGLFYISKSNTKTKFIYKDPWLEYLGPLGPPDIFKTFEFTPNPGTLLIWRSDIQHAVSVHKEKNIRYTLSFNTFFDNINCNQPAIKIHI